MSLENEELDGWVYFDGPEPELLQPVLDSLRDLPPATLADRDRAVRRFLAAREAKRSGRPAPTSAELACSLEESPGIDAAPVRAGGMRMGRPEEVDPFSESLPAREIDPFAPAPLSTSAPASTSSAHRLAGTGPALDLPREVFELRGRLPFVHPSADRHKAARTLQVPVMRKKLGDTAPLDDTRLAEVRGPLPFTSTVGTGTIPFPRMTLEQYTSLEAELAVGRATREALFEIYQVLHEASLGALRADWEGKFVGEPEERARFARLLEQFTAWVRVRPE